VKRHLPAGLLVALLVAGCTAPKPVASPAPSGSSPVSSQPAAGQACDPNGARLTWSGINRKDVITAAAKLTVGRTGERATRMVQPDSPLATAIDGLPPGESWQPWLVRQAATKDIIVVTDSSPSFTGDASLLGSLTAPGNYIGFYGVRRITAGFTVTCGSAPAASGRLTTWERPTKGVLECTVKPDPKSVSALVNKYC
jgi:hypothetical protein